MSHQGWMAQGEITELARLAAHKDVVEVGAWMGLSTRAMANVARTVVTFDWFKGDQFIDEVLGDQAPAASYVRDRYFDNLEDYDNVTTVVGDYTRSLWDFNPQRYDFAFYDGDHSGELTQLFIDWVFPLTKKRQWIIAFHDYKPQVEKHVPAVNAINAFALRIQANIRTVQSLAVIRGYNYLPNEIPS